MDLISLYRDAQTFPAPVRHDIRQTLRAHTQEVIDNEWETQEEGEASARPTPSWAGAYSVFSALSG